MLRRAVTALRGLLLVMGALILLWIPFSYYFSARYDHSWRSTGFSMISFRGCLHVALLHDGGDPNTLAYVRDTSGWPAFELKRLDKFRFFAREALWPVWRRQDLDATHDLTFFWIPLWLLAFLCLAWPVTSFVIARRRRRGRGFEVEATKQGLEVRS